MKIAHLADIHIRLASRHDEYREVFSKLYKMLREDDPDYIVVAGDIAHSKTTLSPESVELVREFLINLAKIAEIIIIPGNHDLNLSNPDRLDAISPCIPEETQHPVFYFKETGVYSRGNIEFGVWSCIDGKDLKPDFLKEDSTKIALFHGALQGCVLDTGYELENAKTSYKVFDDFDIVMLGDIHKYQTFRDDKTIVYPGSLIQQTHGESQDKGYVLWDVEKKTHIRRLVHNDYGFATIEANSEDLPDVELPKKCRLRFIWSAPGSKMSQSSVNKLTRLIHDKYSPLSVSFVFKPEDKDLRVMSIDDKRDIRDISVQQDLLRSWLKTKGSAYIDEILDIDKKIFEKVDPSVYEDFSNATWDIRWIKMTNFMSYAKETMIDFSNLRGVIGLFGDNAAGKSVVIDAILYALFNKITRNVKNEELINKYTDSNVCEVEMMIDIDGVSYVINRKTTLLYKKNSTDLFGSRTDLKLFCEDKSSNEFIDLTGEQRTETEKVIRNAIGSFEDFLTVILSKPEVGTEFIDQGNAARTNNIIRFLGLTTFLKKHDIAKKKLNEIDWSRKQFDPTGDAKELEDLTRRRSHITGDILQLKKRQESLDSEIDQLLDLKVRLNEALSTVGDVRYSEEDLRKQLVVVESSLIDREVKIKDLENRGSTIEDILKQLERSFVVDDDTLSKLHESKEKHEKILEDIEYLNNDIRNDNKIIEAIQGIIKDNPCPVAYDPKHSTCKFLEGVDESRKKLKKIEAEVEQKLSKIAELKKEDEGIVDDALAFHEQSKLRDVLSNASMEMDSIEAEIREHKGEIKNLLTSKDLITDRLALVEKNKESLEKNKKIKSGLDDLDAELNDKKDTRSKVAEALDKTKEQGSILSSKLEIIEDRLKKAEEYEKEYEVFRVYCDAMHRSGIPTSLLRNSISTINYNINKALSDSSDFMVYFEMDDESDNIEIYMRYDGKVNDTRPARLASGMEKLLINFSIRYALLSISQLNKPSTWFIDEGFGVCRNENLDKIDRFFNNVKDMFKNIVMITHIDQLKDVADYSLNVEKKEGVSILTSDLP